MRYLAGLLGMALLASGCSGGTAEPVVDSTTTTPEPIATTPPTATSPSTTATTAAATPTTTSTTSTTTTTTTTQPPELLGVEVVQIAEVAIPLAITSPSGDERLFVAEREGTVRIVSPDGQVGEEPFLDITDTVGSLGVEQGLLGMAFHPSYSENGRLFVYYTDANDDTLVAEYTVSSDPDRADPASARQIIFFDQPTERHNGGMLEFGPDGYLYIAVGDGGDGGHNGQKTDTLFGTILRIDVDGGDPYAVPTDNPFVDGGGAPEVWLYGLRNPWRFSIDPETELIYIGDVGQGDREEIDVLSLDDGGANLGWIFLEGPMCFRAPECRDTETVLPVHEYTHSEGCSVTGGRVYRGSDIPELQGTYFFADWCRKTVRSFSYEGGELTDLKKWTELAPGQINTFGTDGSGELYMGTWDGGVWKLVPIRADS